MSVGRSYAAYVCPHPLDPGVRSTSDPRPNQDVGSWIPVTGDCPDFLKHRCHSEVGRSYPPGSVTLKDAVTDENGNEGGGRRRLTTRRVKQQAPLSVPTQSRGRVGAGVG